MTVLVNTSSTSAAASHCKVYSMRGTLTSGRSTFGLSSVAGMKFCKQSEVIRYLLSLQVEAVDGAGS